MMKITFTRRAMQDARKLSKDARRRVELAIDALFDDVRAGDRLHGEWKGYWKLRAGDYRVVYKINNERSAGVQYVRHRRRAYRKR